LLFVLPLLPPALEAVSVVIAHVLVPARWSRHPHAVGRHAPSPVVLPEAPWTRAGLLRFCLSDVLPYQLSELPPARDAGGPRLVVEEWPQFESGRRVRDLANAVKEVADIPLVGFTHTHTPAEQSCGFCCDA
jgi:hypothetical protein